MGSYKSFNGNKLLKLLFPLGLAASYIGIRKVLQLLELKTGAIYGVSEHGRGRPIIKHHTQVRIAGAALDTAVFGLGSALPRVVYLVELGLLLDGVDSAFYVAPERGHARGGEVLVVPGEDASAADCAAVVTGVFLRPEVAGERALHRFCAQQPDLVRGELQLANGDVLGGDGWGLDDAGGFERG